MSCTCSARNILSPTPNTVFLACFHPYVSRNIYATPFLDALRAQPLRLILLVPEYKLAFFKERFERDSVEVVGVPTGIASRTRTGVLLKRFAELAHVSVTNTVKYRLKYHHERKLKYLVAALVIGFVGRSFLVRSLVRRIGLAAAPRHVFEPLFKTYNPSLVFGTDVFNENDVNLMQVAKLRGVRTVGFVRSWDNPSKYLLRVFPDRILAGSAVLAAEIADFQGYPKENVTVVGNPHYDRYGKGATETREVFCARFGLNPAEPFVLFCPVGDDLIHFNDFDPYIAQLLAQTGRQVLVRLPPASAVRMEGFAGADNVVLDRPGVVFNKTQFGDREITLEEDERLINSLVHAAVVVTGPTSLLLDAPFFDRPLIAADLYPTPRNRLDAIYEYGYYHILKYFSQAPGALLVKSPEALTAAIDTLVADPSVGAKGRAQVRALWFSHDDGHASERLANEILRGLV